MNSERRRIDRQGRQFIPMNVEGGNYENKFISPMKMLVIIGTLITTFAFVPYCVNNDGITIAGKVILLVLYFILMSVIYRYIVFEERYYYKMYKKMQSYSNPTSDVFWNITHIRHTMKGDMLMYSDGKVGVLFKPESGSMIGRDSSFRENHFDALSDFYKEVVNRGLNFVQLNMMEEAKNDNRIPYLEQLIASETNSNLKKLLEMELGHIKSITRATLYETDYFLIYTDKPERIDYLLDDVNDCAYTLLDGAYVGYDILDAAEIIRLHKEIFGVSYFDYNQATLNVFRELDIDKEPVLNIKRIHLKNGRSVELTDRDVSVIKNVASYIKNEGINPNEVSILNALGSNKFKEKYEGNKDWGIDLKSFEVKEEQQVVDNNTSKDVKSANNQENKHNESKFKFGFNKKESKKFEQVDLSEERNTDENLDDTDNEEEDEIIDF